MTVSKKPWLLLTQAEKDTYWTADGRSTPGLLASGLQAALQKNQELYQEIEQLKLKLKELKDAAN